MHTFYKEHPGSYAVAVPWMTIGSFGSYNEWHTLFSGLSLIHAMQIVRYLNGGAESLSMDLSRLVQECVV